MWLILVQVDLVDRQAIADVVLRYCRGIDRLDLELVRDCYHADATDEHGTFTGTRDEYVDWVAGVLTRFTGTMHVVANQLIEVRRRRRAQRDLRRRVPLG